jgi:hypothetical protein
MISMDWLDSWIIRHVAWWAPYGLTLCVPVLLAWFPGANARLRGHERARAVSTFSWLTTLVMASFFINSDFQSLALIPGFAALWMGSLVWSYGKRELPTKVVTGRGFEIVFPPALNLSLELASSE